MTDSRTSFDGAPELARQFFEERQGIWARPLVNALEKTEPKLALRWATLVFSGTIAAQPDSTSRVRLQSWLNHLQELTEGGAQPDLLDRSAFEIWEHDPTINIIERAIARLYWALMNYLLARSQDYQMQITSAVVMLSENNLTDQMDERILNLSVNTFFRLKG